MELVAGVAFFIGLVVAYGSIVVIILYLRKQLSKGKHG